MEDLKKEYKNVWESYTEKDKENLFEYAERYRQFISRCKTERECVQDMVKTAEEDGYKDLNDLIGSGESLKPGAKVYANYNDKTLVMYCIGKEPLTQGLNILGAHLDSPRLDLKPTPLYEDSGFAMFKSHYYGGIKKYQWVALPLAIHGVVVKKSGEVINVTIGEDENDPVVGVSDLLIHLAKDQMKKKLGEAIEGEDLNICLGSIPINDEDEKEKVKSNILVLLNEKYGIVEEDLVSSELQVVPAGPARDYGLDRSMIIGYGQDDRVCAYASLEAQLEVSNPDKTTVTILVDKEEVGSMGASGMQSRFFENTIAEVLNLTGEYCGLNLSRTLSNSKMLSSDVTAGYDPNFPSVMDKHNSAYFGRGVVFNKYTGSRGKSGSSEANAEYVANLRRIMAKENVTWQTSEMGKVDQGGGGTIAYILANLGMEVIDCGVPVHSMHAPWEITSKADLYEMKKAYIAFLKHA